MYMHKLEGYLHEKKISRTELCKAIGVSEPTLRRYIKEEGFSIRQIKTLSKYLGLSDQDEITNIFFN